MGMQEKVPDSSVDLVFTDPPYGIKGDKLDAHYLREEQFVVPGYIEVPLEDYQEFSLGWIREVERCLRPGGSVYIVSGYTNLHHILNALHATNLEEINHLIASYTFGVYAKRKWVSSHYHVLYWSKPPNSKRTFNHQCRFLESSESYKDRLSVQALKREYKPQQIKNKNQLPESMIDKFILYSSNRGEMVMDPFAGSFSTGRSALRYGRHFIGFEKNPHAVLTFAPSLNSIKVVSKPRAIKPSTALVERRQKMRESWKAKRLRDKGGF